MHRFRVLPLLIAVFLCQACAAAVAAPARHSLRSPDGKNLLRVQSSGGLSWSLHRGGKTLLQPSRIGMQIKGTGALGASAIAKVQRDRVNATITAQRYARRSKVDDRYNRLVVHLKDGLTVRFRLYDDAAAYRIETKLDGDIVVENEIAEFNFTQKARGLLPITPCRQDNEGDEGKNGRDCFHSSYEDAYTATDIAAVTGQQQAYLPALVDPGVGAKLLITEADLDDYPGMWLTGTAGAGLRALFARYPLEEQILGEQFPSYAVKTRADYIAKTKGKRQYPWRVLAIAENDRDLPGNDIVFRLGAAPKEQDWGWVRPGKSQSEWLYSNQLYGVDFESGYNTQTYRHYIDFAEKFGLEYLFFDFGWSDVRDLTQLTEEIDVKALIREARDAGLGVVLWSSALAVRRDLENDLDRLKEWGATGIMIDFIDRDDQPTVNFYRRVLREAAKREMIVNFHGAFKPTGEERTFPNAVTREGVMVFEYNKWSKSLTPEHEVTVPFIRGVAGVMDYEPGAMRNATKGNHRAISNHPMSQGTRIHQLAMFLVFESVYAKLGGNVSDYRREPEYTRFMTAIPTVWKETRILDGKVGDYIVTQRTAADGTIYVGAMSDWSARTVDLPLDFLGPGQWDAEVFSDGLNAAKFAADYARSQQTVRAGQTLSIHMAPGGGWVARFRKR